MCYKIMKILNCMMSEYITIQMFKTILNYTKTILNYTFLLNEYKTVTKDTVVCLIEAIGSRFLTLVHTNAHCCHW